MKNKHMVSRILAVILVLVLCLSAVPAMAADVTNIATDGITTGGGAWLYTAKKVENSKVTIKFSLSASLEGGNWVDFALRGNNQDAGDWFTYQNGLVLRLNADPTWGTAFKVGYGGGDGWFDATYGESNQQFNDVDWTQAHTVCYSVKDVYEGETKTGIRIEVSFDGQALTFKDMNNAGYTSTSDGSYIFIPTSYLETAPAEHFTESYLFAWGNGKNISVQEAYLEDIQVGPVTEPDPEPTPDPTPIPSTPAEDDEDNLVDDGYITPGKAWIYLQNKIYNHSVSVTFHTVAQLEGGNWVDFALRGNSQSPDDWFTFQNGLVLRLMKDPTWGTFFKVGYGGGDGWFDATYGESNQQFNDVDWTQEHTISYTVGNVYDGDTLQGIRIEVSFDGQALTFKDMNNAGYTSTSDGSYIFIPASYLETAPAEHFTESYLFVWGMGKDVTVTNVKLAEIKNPTTGDGILPVALTAGFSLAAAACFVCELRKKKI